MSQLAARGDPGVRRALAAVATIIGAVVVAVALGAATAKQPQLAAAAAAGIVIVSIAVRAPAALLAVALVGTCYTPEVLAGAGPLSNPELQKALLLGGAVPALLVYGIRREFTLPLFAYGVLALLALLHNDLIAGLGGSQMLSSYVTLTVAWILLAVNWDWQRDGWLLKLLALLPLVSLSLGLVFQAGGLHDVLRPIATGDTLPRLQGAGIPVQLAMASFLGSFVGYVTHRWMGWRLGLPLLAVNALILVLTLSRGASIAWSISMLLPLIRFAFGAFPRNSRIGLARAAVAVALVAAVVTFALPRLQSRDSGTRYYPGQTSADRDRTSGRDQAWDELWAIGKQSPLFGHGLGSGPLTKLSVKGFQAQHNEYLRLFVEGGYVGGGLALAALLLTIGLAIRRAPRGMRLDLLGVAVGLGVLAFTDNPLNTPSGAVTFGVLLGLCASAGRAGPVRHVSAAASPRS